MNIKQTRDFEIWFNGLTLKERGQIKNRFSNIEEYDYLGDIKRLGEGLFELRWKNGRRIYFAKRQNYIYILIGGHKNEQEKNIKSARRLLR